MGGRKVSGGKEDRFRDSRSLKPLGLFFSLRSLFVGMSRWCKAGSNEAEREPNDGHPYLKNAPAARAVIISFKMPEIGYHLL